MARRGDGFLPTNRVRIALACAPETRTTEIAFGGRPEDRAKMVWSRGCIAYLALKVLEDAMKFATIRPAPRAADAEHLLQVMLRNFRRICAARGSFRGREAIAFRKISKLF